MSLSLPSTILPSSPTSSAAKVLALIESEEGEYQTSLTGAYQNMSEKTYKSLRRALPMTRSKMDWDKACTRKAYPLPIELTKFRFWVTSLGQNCPLEREGFHKLVVSRAYETTYIVWPWRVVKVIDYVSKRSPFFGNTFRLSNFRDR